MELHSYQEAGLRFLRTKRRAILSDEMGLGKTVQALMGLVDAYLVGNLPAKVLIICPKSVKQVWVDEIYKWLGLDRYTFEFTILGYNEVLETVRLPGGKWKREPRKDLPATKWGGIIVDEAHRCRNRKSKTTVAITKIASKNPDALLFFLTGTPIVNRAEELWPLLHMISPKKFSSFWAWAKENFKVEPVSYGNFKVNKIGKPFNAEALKESLRDYVLRRENREVFPDKPEPLIQTITVSMDEGQKKAYLTMYTQLYAEIVEDPNTKEILADSPLTKRTRLRQIAISPFLMDPHSELVDGCKLDALLDFLEDFEGKLVLFSTSARAINRISKVLNAKSIRTVTFTGDLKTQEERTAAIDLFINDIRVKVIAMTIGAGGEGINGLQYVSHTMMFLDEEQFPSANKQAIARLDRIGQRERVLVYRLQTKGTVEARIEALNRSKGRAFDQTIPLTSIKELFAPPETLDL